MAIYRGIGGAGDSTTDATVTAVTEKATEAASSASSAATSASSASTSASNASTSATNASNSASNASTSETNASNSASAASTSASNASTSETNAAASASAASTSETNAAASESAASTSETNAATSETNAATSETNASSSASAASTSASNAATSESNASTSETNAATSATNAATSETNAGNSATAAASSASSASTSASTATTKASEASTSATNAATSETNAATSETNAASSASSASTSASTATTKASEASTSATNAATSATNASNSASAASTSATNAATSETNAQTAADTALSALDNFDDRYLGQKASDPTLDNDGDALVAGALYFNTTDDVMKVYEGSVWVAAYASLSGTLVAVNNLSDVASVSSSRTNLGLGTAATTASTDYATAAQGALADSAVQTETNNLSTAVTWANVPDANITQSSVTQHQAALSVTESQISDLGTYLENVVEDTTPQLGGDLASNGNDIIFGDNDKAKFGAGNDLLIYHSGGHSLIVDNGIGDLYIRASDNFNLQVGDGAGGWQDAIRTYDANRVDISHAGSVKLATTATGVDVTGTVTADGLTLSESLTIGTGGTYQAGSIYSDSNWGMIFRAKQASPTQADFRWANSSDTERMRIDSSGNVGIGTSSPSTALDVNGTITTDGLTTSGDINFGDVNKAIFGASSDLQIYHTGGASVIRDSGTGSLYIDGSSEIFLRGTSGFTNMIKAIDGAEVELYHNNAPKLSTTATGIDVTGTVTADGLTVSTSAVGTTAGDEKDFALLKTTDGSQVRLREIRHTDGTAWTTTETKLHYSINDDAAKQMWLSFYNQSTAGDNIMRFGEGENTEWMRIDNGNVGIGTTSPAVNLHVSSTGTPSLRIQDADGSDYYAQISQATGNTIFDTRFGASNGAYIFRGLGGGVADEYMRIDSSGNVGIGTSSPSQPLHVVGGAVRFENTQDTYFQINTGDTHLYTAGSHPLRFGTNSTERMRIASNGNVGIGDSAPDVALDVVGSIYYTGTISDVSDRRLKENVLDLSDSLNKVCQLNAKSYTLIADRDNEEEEVELGFIAQEVQTVFPEVVKNIQKYVVDENGENTEEEINYLGVSYIQLIAPMVEAIKELKTEVDILKAKVTALEVSNGS